MDQQQKVEDNDLPILPKKEYSKPELTILGKVSELTAGGSGRSPEFDENGDPVLGQGPYRN